MPVLNFCKKKTVSLFLMFLIILPLIFLILVRKAKKIVVKNPSPPGPPGLPFIGNMLQFDSAKPHEFLWQLSPKYGPLMSLKLGSMPILLISSAKMAKVALKNLDKVCSGRRPFLGQDKLSYNAVDIAFVPYSDYWREIRKVFVLHLFSSKRVQSFRTVREDEISSLIQKIRSKVASSSQLVNLSALTLNFTSTLICRIAFGKRFREDGLEKKRFDEILQESQAMMAGFFITDYFPLLSWLDNLSGMVSRLNKNFKELDLFYQELIEEHLNPNRPKSMKNEILDLLIQLKEEQSSAINLTWDHIKALLMDIFVGGTDTSAATIVWTMTALMKNPSKLERLQAEIRDFAGNKGAINEEDIQELAYLKAVVHESMRLYPPVPLLIPRETLESCRIEGYQIEPKTIVYVNAWAIGRDPECWENPGEFLPERFLDSSNMHVKGQHFGLIPFGAGRRCCPGISLGLATVQLALANLIYSFDWELPTGMKIEDIDTDAAPGLTMHKKNALCLVAKQYA